MATKAVARQRKFDGKVYKMFDWAQTKREAEEERRDLKKDGKLVRVTVAAEGYFIWVR